MAGILYPTEPTLHAVTAGFKTCMLYEQYHARHRRHQCTRVDLRLFVFNRVALAHGMRCHIQKVPEERIVIITHGLFLCAVADY